MYDVYLSRASLLCVASLSSRPPSPSSYNTTSLVTIICVCVLVRPAMLEEMGDFLSLSAWRLARVWDSFDVSQ